jgi:hypothetical protein
VIASYDEDEVTYFNERAPMMRTEDDEFVLLAGHLFYSCYCWLLSILQQLVCCYDVLTER